MQPKRQKLLNVKCGPKMAEDDTLLSAVKLPKVVMMMGSTEASIDEISRRRRPRLRCWTISMWGWTRR